MNSVIKTDSMHEMLFEKRNKDYGAYVIRGTYNDTVVKALVMVASTLLLFIGSAYAYNNFFSEKVVAEVPNVETGIRSVVVNLKPIEEKQAQPMEKQHFIQKVDAQPTIIKDAPVEPEQNKNLAMNAPPNEGQKGDTTDVDPVIGDPKGTGPATITVVPPVDPPVMIADVMPEYIGGQKAMMEFLSKHMDYPELSKITGVEGTVFVNFVVDAEGKVTRCKVVKGISKDCDEEALRVVSKMPNWKPGSNAGVPVSVVFNLPVRFKLN